MCKKFFATFLLIISFAFVLLPQRSVEVKAEGNQTLPTALYNLRVGLIKNSELVPTQDGYDRIFFDGYKICIEEYDKAFNIKDKRSIEMELPTWGGFFAGKDAYYIAQGKNNIDENDDAEVLCVIKYNKNWERIGAANITGNSSIFGGEVGYIFQMGTVDFTEVDNDLYIVTGHRGYVDPMYNQGHQGFLMVKINEDDMTGSVVQADLYHSFAQYIDHDEENLYVLEQSEGGRCTTLKKINQENLNTQKISVLDYGGVRTSAWSIPCYASVDGVVLSDENVLGIGTSIDQSLYDTVDEHTSHNIYLTITPKNDFRKEAVQIKWLTDYKKDKSFAGLNITKINDDRFLVAWDEYDENQEVSVDDLLSGNVVHYVFIDGNGEKISQEFRAAAPISDCQPVFYEGKIYYYASEKNMVDFYSIDAYTGEFNKYLYKVVGDGIGWELKDETLIFYGNGALEYPLQTTYRRPISSAESVFYYSTENKTWEPLIGSVKKIVVEEGITSICDNAFNYFSGLTDIDLKRGIKSIGNEAFKRCEDLKRVIIPSTVTQIGDDILWTGYTWNHDNSKVVRAEILCEPGSAANDYAKKNNIKYFYTVPEISSQVNIFGKPELKWEFSDEFTDNYVAGYDIYRSDKENGEYTKVANVSQTKWMDMDAQSDLTYYYKVRAIQNDGYDFSFGNIVNAITTKQSFDDILLKRGEIKKAVENNSWESVNFSLDNTKVASCDAEGSVTGLAQGRTTLRASYGGSQLASVNVRVLFDDVTNNESAFFEPIYWAADNGITTGVTPYTFLQDNSCTRGQMVTFLWRAAGKPSPITKNSKLTDLNKESPFYDAILWASEQGITTGFDDNTFRQDDTCTRGQIVTFLWRFAGKPAAPSFDNVLSDVRRNGNVFYDAIMWAAGNKVTTGFADGTFRQDATCTRGQGVTFLYRYMLK